MSADATTAEEPLTVDSAALLTWADVVHHLVDEARVEVSADGLRTEMTDPANVAMIDATLTTDAADGDHPPTTVGFPLQGFSEVASAIALTNGSVVVAARDGEDRAVEIVGDRRHATLDCIDPDSVRPEPDYSDEDWTHSLRVRSDELRSALACFAAADLTGISFDADPRTDSLTLQPCGDEKRPVITLDARDLEGTQPASSVYSRIYLEELLDSFDRSCAIDLELADDYPLRATFHPDPGVSVEFTLAPRVQS